MRSSGRCGLVVVLLSACTRPNPAFEGDGGDGAEGDGTGGGVTVDDGPMSSVTAGEGEGDGDASETRTTSADGSADGPSQTDGGPSVTESGTDSQGHADTDTDTGSTCELSFPPRFGITATPSFEQIFGECNQVESLRVNANSVFGNMMSGQQCTSDECIVCPAAITLTFDAPLPDLIPNCYVLTLQFVPGTCELVAYTITPSIGEPTLAAASNVVVPMISPPELLFHLAMAPIDECVAECDRPPGHYALRTMGGTSIPPDGMPVSVPGLPPYEVVNAGSGIDVTCDSVGRWHAILSP